MEQYRREDPLIPEFLKGRRGLVWFARATGIFFLISALVLSIWQVVGFSEQFPERSEFSWLQVYLIWQNLVARLPWGVIIILLAEVVDRLNGDDYEKVADSDQDLAGEE